MSQRKGNVITFFLSARQKENPAVCLYYFFLDGNGESPFIPLYFLSVRTERKYTKKEPPPRYYRALRRIGQAAR